MKSFFIISIVFLMAGAFAPAFFVKQVSAQPVSLVTRNENLIIKKDGWQIPDISNLKIEGKRAKLKRYKDNPRIYRTSYETNDFEMLYMNFDGTADIDRKVIIHNLETFDINKKIFCYRMQACLGVVAVIFYKTYYDLDGDGIFETWDIDDSITKSLIIPNWAVKK